MIARARVLGTPSPQWSSLGRTYRFYCDAVEQLEIQAPVAEAAWDFSLVYNLSPSDLGKLGSGPPSLVVLHGAGVIDRSFVEAVIRNLRRCDGLVATCQSDVEIIGSICGGAGPVVIVPPLRNDIPAPDETAPSMLREILGIPPHCKVITFVGRLVPHKNVHHFLKLLSWLRARNSSLDVRGVVVGDFWSDYPSGMSGAKYASLVSELGRDMESERVVVRLRDGLDDGIMSLLLGGSDVVVHPSMSLDENFGYVPVEAMGCGTPVVAFAYGGFKDTVAEATPELVAPTWHTPTGTRGDYRMFDRIVERLLRDGEARCQLGRNGQSFAERFNLGAARATMRTGIAECLRRQSSDEAEKCTVRKISRPESGWIVDEPDWSQRQLGAEMYALHRTAPPLAQFRSIRPFGQQDGRGYMISVSDPLWAFTGNLPAPAMGFLRHLQSRWTPISALDDAQKALASEFLQQGVIEASTVEEASA